MIFLFPRWDMLVPQRVYYCFMETNKNKVHLLAVYKSWWLHWPLELQRGDTGHQLAPPLLADLHESYS